MSPIPSTMSPKVTYLVARFLIASIIVGLGAEHLLAATQIPADRPGPSVPWMLFRGFQTLAGIAIMLGIQSGRLSLLMAVTIMVDAFTTHSFWRYQGSALHDHLLHFLKNLSVVGGLLLVSWIESSRPHPVEIEDHDDVPGDVTASGEKHH